VNWLLVGLAVCPLLGTASAQRAQSGAKEIYDGFEEPSLNNVWETRRFVEGAVHLQGTVVRAGRGAAEITVRAGDKFEAGIEGKSDSERAELLESRALISKTHTTYEYAFSMFFPQTFPVVPTRLVIAQWKQHCPEGQACSDDSPVLAIRYISGALRITQDIGKKFIVLWEEKSEFRGRWLDFRVQVRFSPETDGLVNAWLGDRKLVSFRGVTANASNESTGYPVPAYFYFKMGLYRNVMAEPMTVYIDEYRKRILAEPER
jgi:hypothetical protein